MALFEITKTNNSGKYYAVRKGRIPGIYNTWNECKEQVLGFSGADYKSFTSLDEANAYLNVPTKKDVDYSNYFKVYTDGSNIADTTYSYGFVVLDNNENLICEAYQGFKTDEYSKHRNIAGECFGVIDALKWCHRNNIRNILIYHDYIGLKKWADNEWKTNSPISIRYKYEIDLFKKQGLNIEFVWIKGHNGDKWNERADELAKMGISLDEDNLNATIYIKGGLK